MAGTERTGFRVVGRTVGRGNDPSYKSTAGVHFSRNNSPSPHEADSRECSPHRLRRSPLRFTRSCARRCPRRLFAPLRCLRSCRPADPRGVHRGRYREREHRLPGWCRRHDRRFALQRHEGLPACHPEGLHGRCQAVAGGRAKRAERHHHGHEHRHPVKADWSLGEPPRDRDACLRDRLLECPLHVGGLFLGGRPNAARASPMPRPACSASCAGYLRKNES
jgi:hypothetical protein